ncbi:MAG: hypothetical protein WDM80_09330 [Limisphaerales bacterium]
MNGKAIIRWLAVSVAIPVGGFCGFIAGYYSCLGILSLQSMGNSHDDIYTVLGAGGLGMLIGAFLIPFCIWYFTRQERS